MRRWQRERIVRRCGLLRLVSIKEIPHRGPRVVGALGDAKSSVLQQGPNLSLGAHRVPAAPALLGSVADGAVLKDAHSRSAVFEDEGVYRSYFFPSAQEVSVPFELHQVCGPRVSWRVLAGATAREQPASLIWCSVQDELGVGRDNLGERLPCQLVETGFAKTY